MRLGVPILPVPAQEVGSYGSECKARSEARLYNHRLRMKHYTLVKAGYRVMMMLNTKERVAHEDIEVLCQCSIVLVMLELKSLASDKLRETLNIVVERRAPALSNCKGGVARTLAGLVEVPRICVRKI